MVLSLITLIPILGALFLLVVPSGFEGAHKRLAFVISLVPLVLCLPLLMLFPYGESGFHLTAQSEWVPALGISFHIGVDGMSLILVVLTTLLTSISILASFEYIKKSEQLFYAFMLMLETGMIGTFVSLDMFLFFLFWELMLVPMYFIIGIWGGQHRIYAGIKFFLYTAFGSALMLLVIFYLYFSAYAQLGELSFSYEYLKQLNLETDIQLWLFFAFVLAFLIKMPLFPFHTWLPYAHTEAPTAGSVILAGILLKTGVYGFLRFAVPFFPEAAVTFTPFLMLLSIIGLIYGALIAMIQQDVKKLVAYSSVSHMGILLAGILAWNLQGVQGGIIQMINHGLSTGGLFLVVGMIYERRHTRMVSEFGGLASVMPVFAIFFMIFTLSSIGLPGLNGFVGEFLILVGISGASIFWLILAATGVVLGAAYMLMLYQKMMFGPNDNPKNQNLQDLNNREVLVLLPIAVLCFIIGMFPQPLIKTIEPTATEIVETIEPHLDSARWYEEVAWKPGEHSEHTSASSEAHH